jgi:RNA-directed DNA polymerase
VDLRQGQSFGFLGFTFRHMRSRSGRWVPLRPPQLKKRTALLRKLKILFRQQRSRPLKGRIDAMNPLVRGWVQYFAFGHASRCVA